MSDNDGQDIVRGRCRRQMMVKDPFAEKYKDDPEDDDLKRFNNFCVRRGYSVSEGIRAWTNMFGLPKGF